MIYKNHKNQSRVKYIFTHYSYIQRRQSYENRLKNLGANSQNLGDVQNFGIQLTAF